MHPVDAGESGLPSHGGGSLPGADTTVIIEGGAFCPGDIDTLYKAGGVLPPVGGFSLSRTRVHARTEEESTGVAQPRKREYLLYPAFTQK